MVRSCKQINLESEVVSAKCTEKERAGSCRGIQDLRPRLTEQTFICLVFPEQGGVQCKIKMPR